MIIVVLILFVVIGVIAFIMGVVAGIEMEENGNRLLIFEKNKKIKKLRKEISRIKDYDSTCGDYEIQKEYKIRIKELESEIQKELYREMGIKEKED